MGDEINKNFDLPTLIKMGDVDVKRVVIVNVSIRVGDYFTLLAKFEDDAPKGMESLKRIANLEAEEKDYKTMADMMDLLEEIGCVKITPALEEMIKAGKRGHVAYACECAKNLLDSYETLQTRITTAKKDEGSGSSREEYEAQTLKEALAKLDQPEVATVKPRILAVDDAPVIIKTITSVLSDEYKVYGMTDPTLLKKFLGQITPHLFLLDYEMPEINGFELIPIIRSFDEHKETPIIFLTSMGSMEHVSTALSLGACDYIVKPFKGDNLRGKVAKHLVKDRIYY